MLDKCQRKGSITAKRLIGDLNEVLITELFHINLSCLSFSSCSMLSQMEDWRGELESGGAIKYCNQLSYNDTLWPVLELEESGWRQRQKGRSLMLQFFDLRQFFTAV